MATDINSELILSARRAPYGARPPPKKSTELD